MLLRYIPKISNTYKNSNTISIPVKKKLIKISNTFSSPAKKNEKKLPQQNYAFMSQIEKQDNIYIV